MENRLKPEDVHRNAEIYNLLNSIDLPDGWETDQQRGNFERLIKIEEVTGVPIKNSTCLDVGCGTGELSALLRQKGVNQYLGVDIYSPSIEKARGKFPREKFEVQDILANPLSSMFDYAFCSGTFSTRVSQGNYTFLEQMLKEIWMHTKVGLGFNFLTETEPDKDPDLFFYSVPQVETICAMVAPGSKIKIEPIPNKHSVQVYLYR